MRKIWHHARDLRNDPTLAERRLWRHLRQKNLGGYKFRRQFPIAGYIVDFACVEALVAIELDGGQHAAATAHDDARTKKIAKNGYRVLRFWNNDAMTKTEAVLGVILGVCDARRR